MAGEDVRLKATVKSVEDELNLIKNQVQQTLLDIREHILDVTNPFSNAGALLAEEKTESNVTGVGGEGGGGGDSSSGGPDTETTEEEVLPEDALADPGLEELPQDDVLAVQDAAAGGTDLVSDAVPGAAPAGHAEEFDTEDAGPGEDLPPAGDGSGGPSAEAGTDEAEDDVDGEEEGAEDDQDAGEDEQDEGPEADDSESGAPAKPAQERLDLVTLAALVRWASITTRTLGRNRVEVLLDTYELAGRISPQVKGVIKNFCALADEDPDGEIPVRDVLSAMVRMEGVVSSGGDGPAHRLMAMLLEDDDEPLTRLGLRS